MSQVRVGHVRDMARVTLSKYQITGPPVQPELVAQAEGLEVRLIMTWPASLSGLLLRESRRIGLNAHHAPTRRRFSLAHELGHWFLRHDLPWREKDVTIDDGPENASEDEAYTAMEGEANEFAGELLAPRGMLKAALVRTQNIEELARIFEISPEALWVRILRHNLLK